MGSSNKKKKEQKKDFVKPKLKVGKAKPKASNVTNTSFRSKAVVLATQSISQVAPTTLHLLKHNISLLTHHASTTRREALSYLTTHLPPTLMDSAALSQSIPMATLIPSLSPAILDQSTSVRSQLLTLFESLPSKEIELYVPKILLYVVSAMTHIEPDIRKDSTKFLGWLLNVNGDCVLRNGGWTKCMWGFLGVLGFDRASLVTFRGKDKRSVSILAGGGINGAPAGGSKGKTMMQHLSVLKEFLIVALLPSTKSSRDTYSVQSQSRCEAWDYGAPHWSSSLHLIPSSSNRSSMYSYLSLFSSSIRHADELGEEAAIEDMDARRRWLTEGPGREAFATLRRGLEGVLKEGGELGRIGGRALGVLQEALPENNND